MLLLMQKFSTQLLDHELSEDLEKEWVYSKKCIH